MSIYLFSDLFYLTFLKDYLVNKVKKKTKC